MLIILYPLIPLALITGPFLGDLVLSIIAFYGLLSLRSNSLREKYLYNKYIILIFLMYLISLTSTFNSNDIFYSLESSLFYFRYPLFIYGGACIFDKHPRLINYFPVILTLVMLLLFFDLIFELTFGFNTLGNSSPFKHIGRYSSFFGDELIMGKYIALLFPYIFLLYFSKDHKKYIPKNLFIFFIPITLFIILLSGERTALVYFVLFLCFLFFYNNLISKKHKLFLFILLSLLTITFLSVPSESKNRLLNSTFNQIFDLGLNLSDKDFDMKLFSEIHELHYKTGINMYINNKVLGIGPKMFRKECGKKEYKEELSHTSRKDYVNITNGCSTHPHNYYIQILAETGSLGFLTLLSIFFFIIKDLVKAKNYNNFNSTKLILIVLFLNFFPFVPTNSFYNNWISIILYLPFSFLLYSQKNLKN